MKNDENNVMVVKAIINYFLILALFLGTITALVSCDKDPEEIVKNKPEQQDDNEPDGQDPDGQDPDGQDPDGQDPNNTDLTPDELTDLLVLENASKMSGDLPSATDGGLLMNAMDTIFTVDKRICNSIQLRHDTLQKITGFNIKLKDATSYMYIPILKETQVQIDSVTAFCLDLDAPCQTSTQVTIQAIGENGAPLDEFERWLKIECLDGSGAKHHSSKSISGVSKATCTIFTCADNQYWLWNSRYDSGSDRLNQQIPGLKNIVDQTLAGCCTPSGMSVAAWEHTGCFEENDSGFEYKVLSTNDYWRRNYEHLFICEDGSAEVHTDYESEWTTNIGTDVNYCDETMLPDFKINDYNNKGTHDYSPGDDHINFSWVNPEGEWQRDGGRIEVTCNTLIIYHNVEGIYDDVTVYKRSLRGNSWWD